MNYKVSLLDVPEKDHVKVLYFSGELDESNINDFKTEFAPLLTVPDVKTFIFHFRDLSFMNSLAIGYFAGVYSDLKARGIKMILAEMNDHINDILTLVGFTN